MAEGGWSACWKVPQNIVTLPLKLRYAYLFPNKNKLQSVDISRPKNANSEQLVDLLKASVAKSNFSLAFPYIDASDERESVESSLISEFTNSVGMVLRPATLLSRNYAL